MARARISVGQEFEVRLDLVNISRKPGLLLKAEELFPPAFRVTVAPSDFILQNGSVEFDKRSIGAFQVVTVRFWLKPLKAGSFALCPVVTYIDDLGEPRTCKPEPVVIVVQQAKPAYEVLPNRVSTGHEGLDALLFGGIPEKYAVMLASPSTDEREQIIGRFLEEGVTTGGTTFHIATEATNIKTLAAEYPSNFYLIVCNPQADTMVQSAPNVFKLKGVENLTDIDIALTKAFRTLGPSKGASRRICIEILSDVLLQHHAITTRRWLSALLPTLKSRGFTVLTTVNPRMHPPEEYEAILSLFDGQIDIFEKETPKGIASFLMIRKMTGQKYLKDKIPLTEE
jgi:KaiC/GvpD/RAD55 family RecA-like ATPase